MKRLSFIHLLLITTLIYSQQPQNTNTLLWRITGKGLTKPSYLYGTIHLTDKKVFFLGDSVYNSIDKTDGFASELDLNSIGMQMINIMMKEEEEKQSREPVKLKDVLAPDIWQRYKETLAEKLGKKAENITVEDLDEMKDDMESDMFKKGDMPTFLDAHLFGLAKKKGKWVGGIEDIEDQLEHITSDEKIENKIQIALYDEGYYRKSLEWLMKIYINQQLDSIDAMYREESGEKDYIMIKRNLKMARRMDSLSAIRSMFFAVGAAHLPGDSGVIELLRARGFQVVPVISSKKIDPSKYVVKSSEEAWFPVDINDKVYTLSMPGIANKFEMLEEYGLHTQMFFDISFMKMYLTMSVDLGEERKKVGADSLFRAFKSQYSKNSKDMKEKVISINGVEGRELRFSTDEGYFIMQMFIPNMERVIFNAVMAFKEQSLADSDTKKYFESFIVNKTVAPKTEDIKWTSYSNPVEAFSIDFPLKPIEKKDVRSEEGKILHSFQAVDLKSPIVYGIVVSSIKEGLYWSLDDSSHFYGIAGNLKMRFENAKVTDSSFFKLSGFSAYRFSMTAISEGTNVYIQILSVLRGNRNYYLYTIFQPGETGKNNSENFLRSFKLLPLNYPSWKTEFSLDKSFSTSSPFPFRPVFKTDDDEEETEDRQRTMMYDTLASHTVFVDKFILPKWYWYESDSAMLRDRAQRYVTWQDSLIDYKTSIKGKNKEAEFTVIQENHSIVKRVKMIISGNEIYEVYGYVSKPDLDKHYQRFFDDFKILKETSSFDLTKPKFKELVETVLKKDKKEIEEVKTWWGDINFSAAELPMLQTLMLEAYPDFDSSYYNTLNWKIIQQIKELDSNHLSVDVIKNKYWSISKENEKIKPLLLNYLCNVSTKESYDLVKQILTDKNYPTYIDIYFSFYDSLKLTATLYPELFNLVRVPGMLGTVSDITMTLIDSNLLAKKMLLDNEKIFIDQANKAIKEKDKNDEMYEYYDLVELLGVLKTPASNKFLTEFSKYSDRHLKFVTMVAMLKNNLPVDSRIIYTLASTDEYRYQVYEELRKLKKLSLFPTDHLSQQKIGQSKLFTDYQDEEYSVYVINAGNRTITYKGKQVKIYLYRVSELNEEEPAERIGYYLGISGPFSLNSKDCYSTHDLTGVYWDEEYDEKKIDALLKKYLKDLEESEKEK